MRIRLSRYDNDSPEMYEKDEMQTLSIRFDFSVQDKTIVETFYHSASIEPIEQNVLTVENQHKILVVPRLIDYSPSDDYNPLFVQQ